MHLIFEENLSEDFIFESEKFDVLFEDLLNEYNQDEAQRVFDIGFRAGTNDNKHSVSQNINKATGSSIVAVGVGVALMALRNQWRKAHGVTKDQIKRCDGNRSCILKAYIDSTNAKIQMLGQMKTKDPKNSTEYDKKIVTLRNNLQRYNQKKSVLTANGITS